MRVGNTSCRAEDAKELIAFATDLAEEAELLENHAPGDDRKEKKNRDHYAGNPTRLGQNIAEVD